MRRRESDGFSAAGSIGQNPRLWQSGQDAVETYQAMWQTILAGETWRGEIVNRNKQDVLYEALLTIAPIRGALDGSGWPALLACSAISASASGPNKKRCARWTKNGVGQSQVELCVAGVDEFRTPLTTILSSAEMLEHVWPPVDRGAQTRTLAPDSSRVKYMTSLLEMFWSSAKWKPTNSSLLPRRWTWCNSAVSLWMDCNWPMAAGTNWFFSSQASASSHHGRKSCAPHLEQPPLQRHQIFPAEEPGAV